MSYSGLTVKNGRLINNRPVGKSGIEEAAELRKMVKKNEKTMYPVTFKALKASGSPAVTLVYNAA